MVPQYTLCCCLPARNSCLVYDWREGFGSYIAITTLYQDAFVVYSKRGQKLAVDPANKEGQIFGRGQEQRLATEVPFGKQLFPLKTQQSPVKIEAKRFMVKCLIRS